MLRLKEAVSPVGAFTSGRFEPVLPDVAVDPAGVRRVVLCSGKVYWDLVKHQQAAGITDTAVVRVERLYPLPAEQIVSALASYAPDVQLRWVQEEPANQGMWPFIAMNLPTALGRGLSVVSRPAASSPAVGSAKRHNAEQTQLVQDAFTG
jgi:2-oxoglutarate dehydrogenase E1 component